MQGNARKLRYFRAHVDFSRYARLTPRMTEEEFGKWVRRERKARDWSLDMLAELLHCGRDAVSRLERGKRQVGLNEVNELVRIFGERPGRVLYADEADERGVAGRQDAEVRELVEVWFRLPAEIRHAHLKEFRWIAERADRPPPESPRAAGGTGNGTEAGKRRQGGGR